MRIQELFSKVQNPGPFLRKKVFRAHFWGFYDLVENMICKRYSYGSYNIYHHQLSYQQKWIHEFDVVCGRKGPIMQPISPLSCPATQPLCATHFTPLHHLRHHHPHHQAKSLGLGWDRGARIQFGRVHFGGSLFAPLAPSSNWLLLLITSLPNFVFFSPNHLFSSRWNTL